MKELLKPFLLGLTILFASLNTYAGSMSGPSEACGTETVTYRADTRLALQAFLMATIGLLLEENLATGRPPSL